VMEFAAVYEKGRKPVVIEGLPEKWPALKNWTPEELQRRFAAERFKVGTDDDGYAVSNLFLSGGVISRCRTKVATECVQSGLSPMRFAPIAGASK
jgi:hypothetical protein